MTVPRTNGVYLLGAAVLVCVFCWAFVVPGARRNRPPATARLVRYAWGYGIGGVAALGMAVAGVVVLVTGR